MQTAELHKLLERWNTVLRSKEVKPHRVRGLAWCLNVQLLQRYMCTFIFLNQLTLLQTTYFGRCLEEPTAAPRGTGSYFFGCGKRIYERF